MTRDEVIKAIESAIWDELEAQAQAEYDELRRRDYPKLGLRQGGWAFRYSTHPDAGFRQHHVGEIYLSQVDMRAAAEKALNETLWALASQPE